jgi:hypothetical protein
MEKYVLINKDWYKVEYEDEKFVYAYCFGMKRTFLKYDYWDGKLRGKREEFIINKELLTK